MSIFRSPFAVLKQSRHASFRAKLLLAMMLVVAGITGSALYFAHRGLEADAQRTLQQQFQAAFANLLGVKAAHRAMIAERCGAVAGALRTRPSRADKHSQA